MNIVNLLFYRFFAPSKSEKGLFWHFKRPAALKKYQKVNRECTEPFAFVTFKGME